MPQDKNIDKSTESLNTQNTKEQLDDENTLHEQLKKIKEESAQSSEENEDTSNPVYEYCS